jgi:integrase
MIMRIKGVKRVRAKGRLYYYDRRTSRRITAPYGSPEFFLELEQIRGTARARAAIPGTLGGLIQAYRASPEFAGLAPRTRSDYQKVFDYLAAIDGIPLIQIDEAAVMVFRDRAFDRKKRRFANYVVQIFRLTFAWGKPRGLVPRLLSELSLIRRPRGAAKANRAWTAEECAAVLAAADGGIKVGIALGMYGALREGDVIRFPWSGYDGTAIQWTQGKTGDDVWLPAHRELRVILDQAGQKRRAVTVVTTRAGGSYTGNGFRTLFFRLIRKLEAQDKIGPGLTFHGLRHTAGKMLDEAGCDTRTIAAVLGHRSEAMARHYSEEGDRRRRTVVAIRRLERQTKN